MKSLVVDMAVALAAAMAWIVLSSLLHVDEFDRGLWASAISTAVYSLMSANRRRVQG